MSKTAISQYSSTPSSNSDVDGIDISEGCPASNLNNAQRSLMSHLKEMDDGTSALTSPSMGQLNVDNLRLDGNTISSTDTNGDITIDPAGTGDTIIASGNLGIGEASPDTQLHISSGAPSFRMEDTDTNRYANFSYGTRVLNIDNVMASGEVGTTVDPATAFRFTDTNGTTEVARFVPDDKSLLIGRTTSLFSSKLTVDADNATENPMAVVSQHAGSSSEYLILFYRGNDSDGYTNTGHIQNTNNATSYNTSSDYRLKENVDYTWDATTRLKQLKPARFNFISEADTTVDGFLAHEVSSIIPEAITGTKDATKTEAYIVTPAVIDSDGNETKPAVKGSRTVPDYQAIDQSKIVPLLTKALIESVEKIEQLEARITALEAE